MLETRDGRAAGALRLLLHLQATGSLQAQCSAVPYATVTQVVVVTSPLPVHPSVQNKPQAVPNMLEIVPSGVNKWGGLQLLLDHLGLPPSALMAVGDGGNDRDMVAGAGVGVAMGNAVQVGVNFCSESTVERNVFVVVLPCLVLS